jgi:hypothetical protein
LVHWFERGTGDVNRDRLYIDTKKKWLLSKALPKIYGDRVVQEIVGPDLAARFKTIEHRPSRPALAKHVSPGEGSSPAEVFDLKTYHRSQE